jgi:hypothetical protein
MRHPLKRIIPWAAALLVAGVVGSEPSHGQEATAPNALDAPMERAWQVVWDRFFHKDVQTFMDYLSSYEPGRELAHLPTAEEVRRQEPNPCGYGTGMEDGMILGGAMLSLLCDRYAVTGDDTLRAKAAQVFRGMQRSATVHGVPGFVARNVCPEDQKSVYINSSRDQYTHFVHGLWKYYRSPLAGATDKEEIRRLLTAVADRMIAFVRPETDYDFGRADGQPCPLGICRMWNVMPHEAARLPMIYAAAWDVTGKETYRLLWRRYLVEAVPQSTNPGESIPAYALLQMQASLELLRQLEPDEDLKRQMDAIMAHVASLAERRMTSVAARLSRMSAESLRMLGPDWRHVAEWKVQKGYRVPQWGPYREVWHLTRERGEAALILLMCESPSMTDEQKQRMREMIQQTDYEQNSGCGILFHLAAYWKARRFNLL